MKRIVIISLILAIPASSLGQVRIMFSHQSVGRNVIADPERADPANRASTPIRDSLPANVAFWDHDYYNFSTDLVTPGTYVPGSILDPAGDIYSISGFGSHRGSEPHEMLLDHLLGGAFSDSPDLDGRAFRDSCMSRFEVVMIKPGYLDVHMNTASSLANYQTMLNEVSDWWHDYNITHGTNIILVVMTSSSLRHPSDYSGGTGGWPDTAAGHAEAEADAAAYRELELWLQSEWTGRNSENRHFSTFELCVNLTGTPSEKFFTKDIFTGTGAGDSSGDHHLNTAGSNAVQEALIDFIDELAAGIEDGTSAVGDLPMPGITLHDAVPNPFNPSTMLSFEMTEAATVRLSIFDISGKRVTTLVDEAAAAGRQQVLWDGKDDSGIRVSSGVYFYRIESESFSETKRMALVK